MKWKTDVRTLQFFIIYNIFSFEMGFSLEPLRHIKRDDKIIFTQPPTLNVRLMFCVRKWV